MNFRLFESFFSLFVFAAWFCLTLIWGTVAGLEKSPAGSLGQVDFLDL